MAVCVTFSLLSSLFLLLSSHRYSACQSYTMNEIIASECYNKPECKLSMDPNKKYVNGHTDESTVWYVYAVFTYMITSY